jgi:hypothetical protein
MPFEGEGSDSIAQSHHALAASCTSIGDDVLIEARLQEW